MKFREFTMILGDIDKPIKMVYENDFGVTQVDDCTIETVRRLTPMEAEELINNLFGTTDIGALDCGDMSDEEIEKIVDKLNSIPN